MSLQDQDRPKARGSRRGAAPSSRNALSSASLLQELAEIATPLRLGSRQRVALSTEETVFAVLSGAIVTRATMPGQPAEYFGLNYSGDFIYSSAVPAFSERLLAAASPAEVWRFRAKPFSQALSGNPDLAVRVEKARSRQLARAALHQASLGTLDGPQRFAGFLIEMARETGVAAGPAIAIELPLSRVEIAHYLALNADTLSRLMSRMKSDGLITQKSRHCITLRDWKAVAALCPIAPALLAIESSRPSPFR